MAVRFFKWIITKWYFWVISIAWGIWSGFEELEARYFSSFLGTLIATFLIVGFIFWIIYMIKKSISKQVKKELESYLKKKE